MNLTPEEVDRQTNIIKAFVSFMVLGTDPEENRKHMNRPCPLIIMEDSRPQLDDEIPPKGYNGTR